MLDNVHASSVVAQEAGTAVGIMPQFSGQGTFESPRFLLACDTDLCNLVELASLAGLAGRGGGHRDIVGSVRARPFAEAARGVFARSL